MKKWNIAAYLRLSSDDRDKSESNSIGNQRNIIKQYIKAVENKHVKFRYTAPKIQSFIIQLQRIFGL